MPIAVAVTTRVHTIRTEVGVVEVRRAPPAGIRDIPTVVDETTRRTHLKRTSVVVADDIEFRRAKAKKKFFFWKNIPAGIPICIAIIIHASARTYKICIIISIVETRRAFFQSLRPWEFIATFQSTPKAPSGYTQYAPTPMPQRLGGKIITDIP